MRMLVHVHVHVHMLMLTHMRTQGVAGLPRDMLMGLATSMTMEARP